MEKGQLLSKTATRTVKLVIVPGIVCAIFFGALLLQRPTTTTALEWLEEGQDYHLRARYDSAAAVLTKARRVFERDSLWDEFVVSLALESDSKTRLGDQGGANRALQHGEDVLDKRQVNIKSWILWQLSAAGVEWMSGKSTAALHRIQAAADTVSQSDDPSLYLSTRADLAKIQQQLGQHEEAWETSNHLLGIHTDYSTLSDNDKVKLAQVLNTQGNLLLSEGQSSKALEKFEANISLIQSGRSQPNLRVSVAQANVGLAYFSIGDTPAATEKYRHAVGNFEAIFGSESPQVAMGYRNLSNFSIDAGNIELAQRYLDKAIGIQPTPTIRVKSYLHERKGKIARKLGNLRKAQDNFEISVRARRKWQAPDGYETIEAELALLDTIIRRYKSKPRLEQRITRSISSLNQNRIGLHQKAQLHLLTGKFHLLKGDYEKAEHAFDNTLNFSQSLSKFPRRIAVEAEMLLGETHRNMGNLPAAIAYYQQAHSTNSRDVTQDSTQLISTELALEIHLGLQQLYMELNTPINDSLSLVHAEKAAKLFQKIRRSYREQGSKLFHSDKYANLYADGVRVASRQFARTSDPTLLERAFSFSERSKAGLLRESIAEVDAKEYADIPPELKTQENKIRTDLEFYRRSAALERTRRKPDIEKVRKFDNEIFRLSNIHDSLTNHLESRYPKYHELKYDLETIAISDVQRSLRHNQVLIEYVVGNSSAHAFVFTDEDVKLVDLDADTSLQSIVYEFRSSITEWRDSVFAIHSYDLFERLLGPLQDDIDEKSIIIVADGPLHQLPFEALITERPTESRPLMFELPFLIRKNAVSYAYSATLRDQIRRRERARPPKDLLAIAPVFEKGIDKENPDYARVYQTNAARNGDKKNNGRLPGTLKEVRTIEKIVSGEYNLFDKFARGKTTVLTHNLASENRIKHIGLGRYKIVHFATHGFARSDDPNLSSLLLYPNRLSREDGVLHLGEVYDLELNADLVVLSACETGLGRVARGEGIVGLTRGFLYSGAENVVVSLWQADDSAAGAMMETFYEAVYVDESYSNALREAKLEYMARGFLQSRPYYWASFVLVGQ